jgi:hypothetical protein
MSLPTPHSGQTQVSGKSSKADCRVINITANCATVFCHRFILLNEGQSPKNNSSGATLRGQSLSLTYFFFFFTFFFFGLHTPQPIAHLL